MNDCDHPGSAVSQSRKNWLLLVLMCIFASVYVERMVFGLSLESIKHALGLSNTQMGVLSGIAFSLFFSIAAIPIARLGDHGNRIAILTCTTLLWSIAASLCGAVTSFIMLLLVRIGVAAGEAGCTPLASSLIGQYFSRGERPRAVARYYLGTPLGIMAGYFAGGWLIQLYGWRNTFVLIAIPGFVLAILAAFTLRSFGHEDEVASNTLETTRLSPTKPGLGLVVKTLCRNSAFVNLLLFCLAWYYCGWGLQQWLPTFFVRTHGFTTGALGSWLAATYGAAGLVGTWMGGEWAARRAAGREKMQLLTSAVFFSLEAVFNSAALLVQNPYLAFVCIGLGNFVECMAAGPIFATIQTLVHPKMRATAQALILLLANVVGLGFGPVTVGAITDALSSAQHQNALRYALLLVCPGYLLAAWHLYRAAGTVTASVASVTAEALGPSAARAAKGQTTIP